MFAYTVRRLVLMLPVAWLESQGVKMLQRALL
jgi:hypothetical protein